MLDLRKLIGGDWDSLLAGRCQSDLEQLADHAANLQIDGIHAGALDLYAYLGVFVEGPMRPNAQQLDELLTHVNALQSSLAELAPTQDTAASDDVLALVQEQTLPEDLADRLAQVGLSLREVTEGDELSRQMTHRMPRLLLVDADLVSAICESLDSLAEQWPEATRTPIVAVGPADQPRRRLKALIEGADLYVSDLQDADLARALKSQLSDDTDAPFRILVVDDDRQLTMYCERVLRRAGMQVHCVHSSDQVRAAVRSFDPELILMDLYMPGEDGMSLTAELRKESDSLVLPIVFLSGEQSEEARVQAISAGGDDYLTKPVRPRHLVAAVSSRVKRVRAIGRQLVRPATSPSEILIRKGSFLDQLGAIVESAPEHEPVLMALSLDQADDLDQRLGLGAKHQLEQAIVQRLLQVLGAGDFLCLWREFGFGVLVERPERGTIAALAESLRCAVADPPFKLQSQDCSLTVSVGMAPRPRGGKNQDDWIGASFAALAAAQRLGGNRIEGLLGADDDELPPERLLWIRELVRAAAQGNGVVAEFQPLLPLRGQRGGHYELQLTLRDKRHPLEGVPRRDYLKVARDLGVLPMIERLALFRALEALDDQRSRSHVADVLVALDLGSFDSAQLKWLERELARRDYHGQVLTLEFGGDLLLTRPALIALVKRLRQINVRVIANDRSGLGQLIALKALPLDGVRLPVQAVLGATTTVVAQLVEEWQADNRTVILDGVDEMAQLTPLWNLGIDYLQGNAVAAPGPRLDYEFGDAAG
jgi:DNA-binding response OmpR family regulator/EAL domain-containing protein (putative c-di-GMP-specific phosphodiesterase class I)